MTEIEDVLAFLGSNATDGYGPSPIPSVIDGKVRALIMTISQADAPLRSTILSLLVEKHGFVMIAFAGRMASLSVRTKDEHLIVEGLEALAIASHFMYFKEVLPIVSLLYRSTQKIGANTIEVFEAISDYGPPFLRLIEEYFQRDEKDQSIDAMGYVESHDETGFRYARTREV